MALSIRHDETEELVRTYAQQKGITMTAAINAAMKHVIANDRSLREVEVARRMAAMMDSQREFAKLPIIDDRTPEEILGYDEYGLPN
jgi:antitoxin VapB